MSSLKLAIVQVLGSVGVDVCVCVLPRGSWDLISPTRDGTCTLCIGSNHWTTREIPGVFIPCACVLSRFSLLQFFVTHWTAAHQALLSIGFFRQEYWNGLLCPPPGDLPNPGVKPESLISPALAGWFFTISTT